MTGKDIEQPGLSHLCYLVVMTDKDIEQPELGQYLLEFYYILLDFFRFDLRFYEIRIYCIFV